MFDPEYDLRLAEWRHKHHIHRATVQRDLPGPPPGLRHHVAEALRTLANSLETRSLDAPVAQQPQADR
jgi:hypothetical protein